MGRFDDKVALVTGAGRGIGRAEALLLASEGARVVVNDVGGAADGSGTDAGPAQQVVDEIEAAGGQATANTSDISTWAGAEALVDQAWEHFGGLDVVVNNAGIAAPLDWIENLTLADYRRMVEVHHLGTVFVTKAAWPHMSSAGYGRIVNTTSEGLLGMVPKNSSYGSAKGAVLGFTRAVALDGARHGIRVNAVLPRAQTRMSTPDILSHVYDTPSEAFGLMPQFAPELVSPAAAYLAHESCELSGELLIAGGGQVMRLALVETVGIRSDALTPEVVAESIEQVLDMDGGQVMTVGVLMSEE